MTSLLPKSSREWNLYRAFLPLAQIKSVDVAAVELGISTITLRRRLERLEQLIDGKLFNGTGDTFGLTSKGQQVFDVVSVADSKLGGLINQNNATTLEATKPNLTLSSSCVYFRHFWLPLIQSNEGLFENFAIAFEFDEFLDVASPPAHDVAISLYPTVLNSQVSEPVGVHRVAIGAHKNYIEQHGTVTPENIGQHRFVTLSNISAHPEGQRVTAYVSSLSRETLYLGTGSQVTEASEAGLGFCLATQWLETAGIVRFKGFFDISVPLYVTYQKSLLEDPRLVEALDTIVDYSKHFFADRPIS